MLTEKESHIIRGIFKGNSQCKWLGIRSGSPREYSLPVGNLRAPVQNRIVRDGEAEDCR